MKTTLILIILLSVGFLSCQQRKKTECFADVKIILTNDSTIISDNFKKELSSHHKGDTVIIQWPSEMFKKAFLANYEIKKDSVISQGFGIVTHIRRAVLLRDPYFK